MWASGALAIHDADTGRLVRVVTTMDLEGQFVSDPVRSPDGTTTYMTSGVEDSWYSCDSAGGWVIALTANGEITSIGAGGTPHVSVDGSHLAYLRSSECHQDPAQTTIDMLTVTDTVVVRDLATGNEQSWTFPGAFDDPSVLTVVKSVAWYGDSLLVLTDGRLVLLDPSEPAVPPPSAGTSVQLAIGDPREMTLLGARPDGTILAEVLSGHAAGSNLRIVALDPEIGQQVAEIAALEPTTTMVDRSGTRWAAIVNGTLIVDGSETSLEPPPLTPGYDPSYQDSPAVVGW